MGDKPLAMVVEDDADLAEIFSQALLSAGFETQMINDGRKALDRLAEVAPAVVVLDLHLPSVSGVDILQHIRADARLGATRVLITTADPSTAQVLEEQADLVLIKPVSFTQLRDLAARLAMTMSS
ncbi:MAG: response regulator [Anaerolineae bacterium]|nr:response regulator [Anaerolineae bacterium]